MAQVENSFTVLEERVHRLRAKVSVSNVLKDSLVKPCTVLSDTSKVLRDAVIKYPVILQVWKKLPLLTAYVDADFLENVKGSDDETRSNLILANEVQLVRLAKCLEELQALKDVLNKDCLKSVPQNSAALEPLLQLHMDQQDEQAEVRDRLDILLSAYNNVISTLSKQFVHWNNLVTQCELAIEIKNKEGIE